MKYGQFSALETPTLNCLPVTVSRVFPSNRRASSSSSSYVIACNWKVYVDNYLEGYHLPIAHPQLFKELDYDAYRVEEHRYYSKQHAPIRELKPGEELGRDRRFMRVPGQEENALYYWLFPNTMFNIYQDNMSSNVILPLGPDRTLTVFEWFFAEPGSGPGWAAASRDSAGADLGVACAPGRGAGAWPGGALAGGEAATTGGRCVGPTQASTGRRRAAAAAAARAQDEPRDRVIGPTS